MSTRVVPAVLLALALAPDAARAVAVPRPLTLVDHGSPGDAATSPWWIVPAQLGGSFAASLVALPIVWGVDHLLARAHLGFLMIGPQILAFVTLPAIAAAGTAIALGDLDPLWEPSTRVVLGVAGSAWVVALVATAVYTGTFWGAFFYPFQLVGEGHLFHPWQLGTCALYALASTAAAALSRTPRRGGRDPWRRPRDRSEDEDPFARARPDVRDPAPFATRGLSFTIAAGTF